MRLIDENLAKEWESTCRRCGLCCFEKWIEGDGTIHHTRIPCRFLDIVTRECRVYEKRLEVDEGCVALTPEVVRKVHWLPDECAYVRQIESTRMRKNKKSGRKSRRSRKEAIP